MSITFVSLIRWLGRIWNACLVVVGILELTGPSDMVRPAPWHEWLGPIFLFGGAFAGFLLCWRWERAAGWTILTCYALAIISANLSRYVDRGDWLWDIIPLTALFFAMPGMLYLIAGALSSQRGCGGPHFSG